jgi:nucleotidyltransferase/DNA polymerase involved in DNA repair
VLYVLQGFVVQLPVRALPGVGFKTEARLKALGVEGVGQLREMSKQQLVTEFGDKLGERGGGGKGCA